MAFVIGSTYNLTTLAPTFLGGSYQSLKVTGIVDSTTATSFRDVAGIHSQIYSLLPVNTPLSISALQFVIFKDPTNKTLVLALDWISSSSLVVTVTTTVTISDGDISKNPSIRSALIALGFKNFTIS